MSAGSPWTDVFAARRAALPGAGPVPAIREEALAAFERRGLPTGRDEDWRYTPLSTSTSTAFSGGVSGFTNSDEIKA